MSVSRKVLAEKIENYMNHKISKDELINWCERSMQEEMFEDEVTTEITARIGLMDAENFEISYEELSAMLNRLGYELRVEVV